jgi:hypothetical protein
MGTQSSFAIAREKGVSAYMGKDSTVGPQSMSSTLPVCTGSV